jgi:4-hydroxy-3-methylbut-2-enyl diphosphate reductase
LGKGRGEILEKIKDIEKYFVVLVYPGFKVKTKEAYSELDYGKIGKNSEKFNINHLHNDFEYSVLKKYLKLKELKKELGENSLLAGSGSSVFRLFKDKQEAEEKYKEMRKKYKDVFLVETMNKKIESAKEMGFCFGVKRAIEEINKIDKSKKVHVLGQLIHNPQVTKELEQKGVKMVDSIDEIKKGTVVISAHGIPDKKIEEVKERGLEVIDLTCPLVKKVHDITKEAEKKGRKVIVFGDREHTEVKGIVGNLKDYKVIKDVDELTEEELKCKLTLLSQTTREVKKFNEISEKIKAKDIEIKDTICLATKDRQKSSIELAKRSDIMIVIGGKMSSNTIRLKEVCSEYCDTRHIETEKELKPEWFFDKERVGITAGASTPKNIINDIIKRVEMIQ